MAELLTVGHGAQPSDDFASLLQGAEVRSVVDVRIAPGSRRHPHFNRDELERWLPAKGISYRWERRLGGFRRQPRLSVDVALRNSSFRAYAAHMRTEEFEDALRDLLADVSRDGASKTAVMCSESVWWRCHRRLIADHVTLIEGLDVLHLMPGGRLAPHPPTEGVRVHGTHLVYDDLGPEAAAVLLPR